jgi:hypothetical protein
VIWRVSFRWRRKASCAARTGERNAEDSLIMVRLRESGTGRKACWADADRIRNAQVRLDVYRRECILVQVGRWTRQKVALIISFLAVTRLRSYCLVPYTVHPKDTGKAYNHSN